VNLYQDKFDADIITSCYAAICDNSSTYLDYCQTDHVEYENLEYNILSYIPIERSTNGLWQNVSIPIDYNFKDCFIGFFAIIWDYTPTYDILPEEASVIIDNISITGTIQIEPPANIQITNNQGFINLRWDPVQGATAYHIYRSEYPDKNFQKIYTVIKKDQLTGEIITTYSDIRKRFGTGITNVTPAVDTFKKPYYYKIATEIALKLTGSESIRTLEKLGEIK